MTWAFLISAAVLFSAAGFMLRRQCLDTLELRAGQIRLVRGQSLVVEKSRGNRREQFTEKSGFTN
jgi:hypothetical protein